MTDTPRRVRVFDLATSANFNEADYLASNPDVAQAVAAGAIPTGRAHFDAYGQREGRRLHLTAPIEPLRRAKLKRLQPLLKRGMPHQRHGLVYDFLTDDLRRLGAIEDTHAVSANAYSPALVDLVQRHAGGLVLDCGAGRRDVYFENVVNLEIVPYATTDVVGLGERLPFRDASFDAVISIAVLEHVRDPFACAAEIARVLKPGGELFCDVPFLQPLHGYPHHYYNMTGQGLRALFEATMDIDDLSVMREGLPVWSLTWILQSWANGLDEAARQEFLGLRLGDLLRPTAELLDRPWVTGLSPEKNAELASVTTLRGRRKRT